MKSPSKGTKSKPRTVRSKFLVYSYHESARQVIVDVVATRTGPEAIAAISDRRKDVIVDGAEYLDDTIRHLQDLQRAPLCKIDEDWRKIKD